MTRRKTKQRQPPAPMPQPPSPWQDGAYDDTGQPMLPPGHPDVAKRIEQIQHKARSEWACIYPYCMCEYWECTDSCTYCHGPCT